VNGSWVVLQQAGQKNEHSYQIMHHHWDSLILMNVYLRIKQLWNLVSNGYIDGNGFWMASHQLFQEFEHLAKSINHQLPSNKASLMPTKMSPPSKSKRSLVYFGYNVGNGSWMGWHQLVPED
jgi:hypothetical protein